jgi:hypothetical protein
VPNRKAPPSDKLSPDPNSRPSAKTKNKLLFSFRWPGAKSRLGGEILANAPIKSGGKFCDVCAGRGALTFWAWELKLEFREWIINDAATAPFFRALRDIGHEVRVPPRSREEFDRQAALAAKGDQRAIVLEPWIAYNGGTYTSGGWSSAGGRRSPESYERSLRAAHKAIIEKEPLITSFDWLDCIRRLELGKEDLVVFDGPYVEANVPPYKPWNILPIEVIAEFKSAEYGWLFCEEFEPMYVEAFGEPVFKKRVQNRASNFAVTGGQETRIECVWTSESYKAHVAKTGAKVPQVLHATLQSTPINDDRSWTVPKVLKELRAVADKIEGYRLRVTAEERERLLPLLIILRRLTKGKKPGFHKVLASIGLNASTVRSWFYRGQHTDEIIAMLEPEAGEVTSTVQRTSDSTRPESVEPGSSEDKTRPIWMDQGIKVRYDPKHRRMEAEANYVEREKKVGKVGDPHKDRIISRITVWQAVYVETTGKVDKSALTKVVLAKLVAAAKDTDYFDNVAITREANELLCAVKS